VQKALDRKFLPYPCSFRPLALYKYNHQRRERKAIPKIGKSTYVKANKSLSREWEIKPLLRHPVKDPGVTRGGFCFAGLNAFDT
jgi:hypothetical protein